MYYESIVSKQLSLTYAIVVWEEGILVEKEMPP